MFYRRSPYKSVLFITALVGITGAAWVTYYYFSQLSSYVTASDGTGNIADKKINLEHTRIPTEKLIDEINRQFSSDAYQAQLKEQQQGLKAGLNNVDLVERIALEREMALQQIKIDNYRQYYTEKVDLLFDAYQSLKNMKPLFTAQDYHAAQTALIKGNTKFAYQLFSRIEIKERYAKEREAVNRVSEAAFQCGRIAQDQLDYRKAYRHYRQAVIFNPRNIEYLVAAGGIAENIALYNNAINYYEAALHAQQKAGGKSARELRPLWINLGNAWNSKGDADKAIKYFEMALASDLDNYGPNHANTAADKNNLGWAWENKGDIDKAIEYYRQALAAYEITLGTAHPATLQVKENLDIATAALDRSAPSRKQNK